MSKTIIVFNEDNIEELTDPQGYPIPMIELKEMIDNICSNFPEDRFSYFVRYGEEDGEEISILVIGTAEDISAEDLEFFAGDYQEMISENDIDNMQVDNTLEKAVLDIIERDEDDDWDSEEEEESDESDDDDYIEDDE